jgi:hypothetical protein
MGNLGKGWDAFETHEPKDAIAELVKRMNALQGEAAQRCPISDGRLDRAQHKKQLLATFATLQLREDIPQEVRSGPFAQPGATHRVACRISNGQPCMLSDHAPDVRGVALKYFTAAGEEIDILATQEGGRTHARNASDFVAMAEILLARIERGNLSAIVTGVEEAFAGKITGVHEVEAGLILLEEVLSKSVASAACEDYWGSVVSLGECAFKHVLIHDPAASPAAPPDPQDDNYLRTELKQRLQRGPIRFTLCLQFYQDEATTPISDASQAWQSPLVPVADLVIPGLAPDDEETAIGALAFNPCNGFTPRGITVARAAVYAEGARLRRAAAREDARRLLMSGR